MNPSLLLIPDRYKAAKLYSQIPDSGAGDLTFARNSNATRVNSAGLIESVRTNLLLNSATLATQNVTVTANAHTVSFFGTGSIVVSGVASGTLVGTGVGDRVELIFTATAGTLNLTVSGTVTNAQLEISDFGATDYIPTTTAAVSVGITANIPRLDYTGGGCPSLLLEPQRTNSALLSEQANLWTKTDLSVTANQTISPSGYADADLVSVGVDASAKRHRLLVTQSITSGTAATGSFFLKANAHSWVQIIGNISFPIDVWANFNLSNGTIGNTGGAGTTATIEDYGNGWYRCSVTGTPNSTSTIGFELLLTNNTNSGRYPLYQSTTAEDVCYIWGGQVENGAYATSYIPTLGASVTRVRDAASKTGISSLIGQTEGTLYWEGFLGANDQTVFAVMASNAQNSCIIDIIGNNRIRAYVVTNNVQRFFLDSAVMTLGANIKIAFSYKSGESVLYVNGVSATSSTAFTFAEGLQGLFADWTGYNYGSGQAGTKAINQAALFTTRLTNAELQSLTSL
jgi:hypothetical protein